MLWDTGINGELDRVDTFVLNDPKVSSSTSVLKDLPRREQTRWRNIFRSRVREAVKYCKKSKNEKAR